MDWNPEDGPTVDALLIRARKRYRKQKKEGSLGATFYHSLLNVLVMDEVWNEDGHRRYLPEKVRERIMKWMKMERPRKFPGRPRKSNI